MISYLPAESDKDFVRSSSCEGWPRLTLSAREAVPA